MHDQGPLPELKEGGQFAQIIGLVNAAKKASDAYLTEVIEKEKELGKTQPTNVTAEDPTQKRKRTWRFQKINLLSSVAIIPLMEWYEIIRANRVSQHHNVELSWSGYK